MKPVAALAAASLFLSWPALAESELPAPPLPNFVEIYPGGKIFRIGKADDGMGINYRSLASKAEIVSFYKKLESRMNLPLTYENDVGMDFGRKQDVGTLTVMIVDDTDFRSVGLSFVLHKKAGTTGN